ncbi:hypothetical protein K474DRAFT_1649280 [Panus rudis PR-1116 ss-1]|nr:hypothetical protein K474DRAFT_1649280 [Panus rudis PR-1116 ss-1]
MSRQFVGPMPIEEFLRRFILIYLSARDAAKIPEVDLTNIPHGSGVETKMYDPFCDALNNSGACGTQYVLKNVSSMRKQMVVDGRVKAPDVMLLPKSVVKNGKIPEQAWAHCKVYLEFKPENYFDAFNDDEGEPLERDSTDGSETRAQLTDYAAALMSCQQRCFVFIIQICGKRARLLWWDRSGCTVSEYFDFHENPQHLAAFFYGFCKLNPEEQGYDTTAKLATAQQEKALHEAIDRFVQDSKKEGRKASFVKKSLDKDYLPYQVTVGTGEKEFKLIIGKPFFEARCACGRGTRVYAAYDPKQKKLVSLKDSWRNNKEGVQSEKDIYQHLCDSHIPHIADNIFIDDVKYPLKTPRELEARGQESLEYVTQRTWTQELSRPAPDAPEWRKGCKPLRELVHCRLVQPLSFPLRSAKNSKEIVTAIRNAVECVYKAWDVKTYHRDISSGNILIDPKTGGFLNDWDHAKRYDDDSVQSQDFRTGTWQFISIALLDSPDKPHAVHDDLESAFWVLLYVSLHYVKHAVEKFNWQVFDEVKYHEDVNDEHDRGGAEKATFLRKKNFKTLQWECAPLTNLIHELAALFWQYSLTGTMAESMPVYVPTHEAVEREIGAQKKVLSLFDEALKQPNWLENDVVRDQFGRGDESEPEEDGKVEEVEKEKHGNDLDLNMQNLTVSEPADSHPRDDDPPCIRRSSRAAATRKPATRTTTRSSSKRTIPDPVDAQDANAEAGPSRPIKRARTSKKPIGTSDSGSSRPVTRSQSRGGLSRQPSRQSARLRQQLSKTGSRQ